jgi:DNA-binding PadR family transcriptional regulator
MSLDHVLLGLLREPASGFDLKGMFDQGIGHFWAAELSQIYPTLKRLERQGWLRSHSAPAKRGRGRRVYEITPTGRRALQVWLAGDPQVGDERLAFLAQIYLMDELGDLGKTLGFFAKLRESVAQRLRELRQIEQRWKEADPDYPEVAPLRDFHVQVALRWGVLSQVAKLKWCDESMRRIRARLKKGGRSGTRRPSKSRTG